MRKTVALTIFLMLFSGPALADQIVLKNGDRLTGKIVKADGAKLKSELIGEVSVDLSSVRSIHQRRGGFRYDRSYLSNPPFGFEKNDLLLTTGLKIKLGELK